MNVSISGSMRCRNPIQKDNVDYSLGIPSSYIGESFSGVSKSSSNYFKREQNQSQVRDQKSFNYSFSKSSKDENPHFGVL